MNQEHAPFDTAVFYDIENLLGGYSFNVQLVADLSLKDIRNRINTTGLIGRFAVQRAYANWSDPRLGILRNEINELGIDPIQVFGFSRDAKRNAADIQLAIDAIDLAHLRPAITNFVIVSGDGGFASLAKKLHEYGRTVIGAAYRKATNQTLRSVCDDFVWIETPDEDEDAERDARLSKTKPVPATNHASGKAVEEAVAALPNISANASRDEILSLTRGVIEEIAKAPSFQRMLDQEGIPTTSLGQAFRRKVAEIDYSRLGFPKLTDLLCHLCTGSKWQIARRTSGDNTDYLIRRKRLQSLAGWEARPDLAESDIHGEAYYRRILSQGEPMIRVSDPSGMRTLVAQLSAAPPREASLASAIESASETLQGKVAAQDIRQGLLTLVNVGAFIRDPEKVPLAEQKLSLRDDWGDPEIVLARVQEAARGKITRMLGKVDDDILDRIL